MPTGETLAAGAQPPLPSPPPTPTAATASSSPASTHRHRRHRTFSSSSSSSSSSLSTVSSAASSATPSPRGRGTTTTSSTTSVPFSWEHHPGIPKTRLMPAGTPSSAPTPLPLPPPLRAPTTSSRPRHHHHVRRRRASCKPRSADNAADPFAAALAVCTRERGAGAGSDDAGLMDALFPARAPPAPTRRRWFSIASAGGVVGLLDLYGCKGAMGGVAEGAFVVRRPVAVVRAGPGRAGPGADEGHGDASHQMAS